MPHIIVKLVPGKSEEQKARLAQAIVEDVMSVLNYEAEAVSVAIEEVARQDWAEKVYRPEIQGNADSIYVRTGYDPFNS